MNDIEIMKKCVNGDTKYFGDIYERYVDKIYRFVFFKIPDREVSEDIVSDVFISALNKISSFKIDENTSVSAWLYKIAYNKVIDYYKSNKIEENIENVLDLSLNTDFGKDIDNKDKLKEIFKYIGNLKKDYRDIFIYRIWEDLSYKEISEITGYSVDNCKQIMSRTLKTISANFIFILLLLIII